MYQYNYLPVNFNSFGLSIAKAYTYLNILELLKHDLNGKFSFKCLTNWIFVKKPIQIRVSGVDCAYRIYLNHRLLVHKKDICIAGICIFDFNSYELTVGIVWKGVVFEAVLPLNFPF